MDKDVHNAIERATQKARRILEEDFAEQLDGVFDVRADGRVAEKGGAHLTGRQHILRDKIVAAIEHKHSVGMKPAEAVADYIRDAAFTTLNRFVALKMLEARELVQECISRGDGSSGFAEFCGLAPSVKTADDAGYRLYIESIFDELSTEVKVLFDRRDAASVLWPKKATFDDLLAVLNTDDLKGVWSEGETIGWVYQFFNSGEERRKMREESGAPRNSRELAIRNQFFTPHYVVQFLCDNTLGRIWYEMREAKTCLDGFCEYMITPPRENVRAKKDPRDIRIIDPACGSGHFLLYCFILLLLIYEEAWADETAPTSTATGRTLLDDYRSLDELRRAAPELILLHNLHGVDIDPRCAQIAQLALWMRAQRAFKEAGIPRSERPIIRRANIVIAEPMPGDLKLVEEFAATLRPAIIGNLFKEIVSEMRLAGEMGPLLQVERKLAISIERARVAFAEQQKHGEGFLPGLAPVKRQAEFDLSGIDNSTFFENAEEQIFASLKKFVSDAVNGRGIRRKLFADDAEQGIAFVELMGRKFDVVLMNPPFGEPTKKAFDAIKSSYPDAYYDLLACFIDRTTEICNGLVGCLVSEACLYGKYLAQWRLKQLIPSAECIVDLGDGVLDAMVKTAALVLRRSTTKGYITFIDVTRHENKEEAISPTKGVSPTEISRAEFYDVPNYAIVHGPPSSVRQAFAKFPKLSKQAAKARSGLTTYDDDRFLRLLWEVPPQKLGVGKEWVPIFKGGGAHTFYNDVHLAVNFEEDGREVGAFNYALYGTDAQSRRASNYYFREGCCYGRAAGRWFAAKPLFPGMVFGDKGPAIIPEDGLSPYSLLAYLNSHPIRYLLHSQAQGGGIRTLHIETGLIDELPYPPFSSDELTAFDLAAREAVTTRTKQHSISEIEPSFDASLYMNGKTLSARRTEIANLLEEGDRSIITSVRQTSKVVDKYLEFNTDAKREYPADEQHKAVDLYLLTSEQSIAINTLSCALGCAFGRFTAQKQPATGTFPLVGPYSAQTTPFSHDILVDDVGHANDLVAKISSIIEAVGSPIVDLESAIGGDIRIFFQKRFFELHRAQYSRSRRKAPIYWQLATPSASYSVWLYVHAFTKDTLFRVQNDYVAPKLAHEQRQLEGMRAEAGANPSSTQHNAIGAKEAFIEELRALLDEVKRVAPLWNPNLNDGVIINFAPLWRLVPQHKPWQKELKSKWDAMCAGTCDWTHLAMHLWPERVIPKCAEDRSLAIAHGLEKVFWFEDEGGKWQPYKKPQKPIADLVRERTSIAVKAALKSLLEAPEPASGAKRSRKPKAA